MTKSAKDKLLETALALFYRDGFHATGIDRILAEAGVSKMTLYKYFPSKDALILGALELRDTRFRCWIEARVAELGPSPREQLSALFDALAEWFTQEGFHGCLFINATAEFGAIDNPIHQAAARHKMAMLAWLEQLAIQAGAHAPEILAQGLMVAMEGGIVMAQVMGGAEASRMAKAVAQGLIHAAF